LGITFVCISSYLILAFLSDMLQIISLSHAIKQLMMYGGVFVFSSFIMALWMIKNSLNKTF
jgi:drug/metabolite transporter superfamily protein YnfA